MELLFIMHMFFRVGHQDSGRFNNPPGVIQRRDIHARTANPFLNFHLTRLCHVDFCKLKAWPPASWAGFAGHSHSLRPQLEEATAAPSWIPVPEGQEPHTELCLADPVCHGLMVPSEMFDISHPGVSLLLSYVCRKRTLKDWLEG